MVREQCPFRGPGTFSNKPGSSLVQWTTHRGGVSDLHRNLHRNCPSNCGNCPLESKGGEKVPVGPKPAVRNCPPPKGPLRQSPKNVGPAAAKTWLLWSS